jgi:hypothetical protein
MELQSDQFIVRWVGRIARMGDMGTLNTCSELGG